MTTLSPTSKTDVNETKFQEFKSEITRIKLALEVRYGKHVRKYWE